MLLTRLTVISLSLVLAACHRGAPATASRVALPEDYCWWAVYRSPFPVDTVISHFGRAFELVGMTASNPSRVADTAWLSASAAQLPEYGIGRVAVRIVAYQFGDSTHLRTFVAANATGAQLISLCQRLGSTAAVRLQAPRNPDGEEKLTVWRRRQ